MIVSLSKDKAVQIEEMKKALMVEQDKLVSTIELYASLSYRDTYLYSLGIMKPFFLPDKFMSTQLKAISEDYFVEHLDRLSKIDGFNYYPFIDNQRLLDIIKKAYEIPLKEIKYLKLTDDQLMLKTPNKISIVFNIDSLHRHPSKLKRSGDINMSKYTAIEERKMILEDYIHEVLSTHDDKTIRITESVSGNEAIVKSNTVIRMRCNPYVTSDCIKWMYKKSTKREYLEYLKVYHEMAFDISASFPWIDDKSEYYVAQFDDGPTLVKYRYIDISIEHN